MAGWESAPGREPGSSAPGGPRPTPTPLVLLAYMNLLELHGRAHELQRALAETTESISWRITAPFRRLGGGRSRRTRKP